VTTTIVEILARSGAVVELLAGQTIRIVDVEGTQVSDLFAVSADELGS